METEIIIAEEKPFQFGGYSHATDRNKRILELLSHDKRPKEIAKELYLSVATVRYSIKIMMTINGYHSMSGLVAAAIRRNII